MFYKITEETRYFISSLDATNPKYLGHAVRAHWGIENNLHWVLDYAFDEDRSVQEWEIAPLICSLFGISR